MRYNNYHKHTHETNPKALDCVVKPIDYINRALEIGHTSYFTTEHGWSGKFLESYDLCKQFNLKMIYAVEAYIVKDRFEKDRTNAHIVLIAKNINGFKQINKIISESNKTGFYYKNRIDIDLLLQLNPDDVYITSACIAGIASISFHVNDFIMPIKDHFKDNFYLEVQSHNHKKQIDHNKYVLELSQKYNISIIHANDSHYIYPEQSSDRDLFLKGKGIIYEEEDGFILDYPDYETVVQRYVEQEVLSDNEIKVALNNTLIFDKCEDLGFTKEIKMPKFKHESLDNNTLIKNILNEKFKKEIPNIDKCKYKEYLEAIRFEANIIEKTNMADYFLWNEKIIDRAVNTYNGILTKTGRGSGVSFYINKLLGFTEIDRIDSDITLYPTRFMSIARILQTGSLPDIDFNWADVEAPIKASKDLLGEDGVAYMYALGTMQKSEAFRNLCRAYNLKMEDYNEVGKNLDEYIGHEYWGKLIKESEIFIDVIDSISPSPCSFVLLDKSISEELSLIRVGKEGDIRLCACIDKTIADEWNYLKNDYLVVRVWYIISETFKLLNLPIPNIKELKTKLDDRVWDLYTKGLTATLNQTDTDMSTKMVMQYKPRSVAELSAFIAAIRPGFASLLQKFLNREKHSTGIPELDELLSDSFCYMLYQESIMKFLVWCGISEDITYDIIKKISKKKFKEKELIELKQNLLNGFIKNTGSDDKFDDVWQVIEDASRYSFNASHSLSYAWDSLYGAYLKVNHPLEYFTVVLNEYSGNTEKTNKITSELSYFQIKLKPVKFRYSHNNYMFDKETNSIYKGITSIKGIGESNDVAGQLLQFKDNKYKSFLDLLIDVKNTSIGSSNIKILIELDFFSEFGDINKLLKCYEIFENLYERKQIPKDSLDKFNLTAEIMDKYSNKITEKLYKEFDTKSIIEELFEQIEYKKRSVIEKLVSEHEYYGYLQSTFQVDESYFIVLEINTKYTPRIKTYNLYSGEEREFKIYKNNFYSRPDHNNPNPVQLVGVYDIIQAIKISSKTKKVGDNWIEIGGTDDYLDRYKVAAKR